MIQLEIQMNFIPTSQFDAKLFLSMNRMWLGITHVVAAFLNCLHEFDPKITHMMLVLMFNPMFMDLFIVINYVGREITTIVPTKVWFYNLNSLIVSNLLKNECFYKASNKFCFPGTTIGYVYCRTAPNDIAIEHVSFCI